MRMVVRMITILESRHGTLLGWLILPTGKRFFSKLKYVIGLKSVSHRTNNGKQMAYQL